MPPFRLVADHEAGPHAVGLLTPPGRRTVLIVRPRALPWDLVGVQTTRDGPTAAFREFGRDEADAATDVLYQALQAADVGVEVVPAAGDGSYVRVRVGRCALLACARRPGQAYQPHPFADAAEAEQAAAALRQALCPSGAGQELYVNSRHFARERPPS